MSKQIDSHILELYEVKKLLGSGAYGHVWKVIDKFTQKQCALKKIFDAFHNDVDAQRTYREITVLHDLDHPNIIKLHRVCKAKNNKDLYLVFQHMEADLHSLVGEDILEQVHLKFVIFQILRSLKYLHSAQLIHRDLKPSNILINSQCEIKVCDFGLVRSLAHEEHENVVLSQEVATRWYRSPEMLLGSKKYTRQTDVWSVGCIIAELLIGNPLFPGESTLNQLQKILQFTGIPSKQSIDSLMSESAESLINQLTIHRKSSYGYFKNSSKQLVDLTLRMLEFNPSERITIDETIASPIFDEFRSLKNGDDICTKFIVPQLDDNSRYTMSKYRQIIYRDIERRYPQIQQQISSTNTSCYDRPFSLERKKFTRSHHSFKKNRSKQKQRDNSHGPHGNNKENSNFSSHKNQHSSSFTNYTNVVNVNNKKSQNKSMQINHRTIYQQNLQNKLKKFEKGSLKNTKVSRNQSHHGNESINSPKKSNLIGKNVSSSQLIKMRSRKVLTKNKKVLGNHYNNFSQIEGKK